MKSLHISMLAAVASLQLVASAPIFDSSYQLVFKDQSSTASDIRKTLKKAEVIPDVLDDFTPLFSLNISYPKTRVNVNLGNNIKPSDVSSSPDVYVDSLEDSTEASDPIFHIQAIGGSDSSTPTPTLRSDTTFALALTDPDATSHADPKMAEMCHWLVTEITLGDSSLEHTIHLPLELRTTAADIQSSELESLDIVPTGGKPTELMSYYPPAPPPKTGYHRYVFVLLAPQAATTDVRDAAGLKKPKERPHWGYGKIGKGVRDWAEDNGMTPVGANFFYAKNKKQ
ncbi:MAG: hypothetical protein LQ349_001962 [Xanthoria aureola]|nr:MAG: hypothetical protein LQ349_001962 [Xanthoria aureola]